MRFKTYFLELQLRFFLIFSQFLLLTFLFYFYKKEVFEYIIESLDFCEITFYSFQLTNIFEVYLFASSSLAIYLTFPFFIIQSFLFLSPALYKYENKILRTFCFYSILFFFLGSWVTYSYTIPFCWKYFGEFEMLDIIEFEPELEPFFHFYFKFLLGSQLFFQGFLLTTFFLVNYGQSFYKISRKIIYFLFLLFSTLITPPDLTSQICLTFLFIIFYEFFIISFLINKNYKKKRVNNGS